jgi:hypothetical protein
MLDNYFPYFHVIYRQLDMITRCIATFGVILFDSSTFSKYIIDAIGANDIDGWIRIFFVL